MNVKLEDPWRGAIRLKQYIPAHRGGLCGVGSVLRLVAWEAASARDGEREGAGVFGAFEWGAKCGGEYAVAGFECIGFSIQRGAGCSAGSDRGICAGAMGGGGGFAPVRKIGRGPVGFHAEWGSFRVPGFWWWPAQRACNERPATAFGEISAGAASPVCRAMVIHRRIWGGAFDLASFDDTRLKRNRRRLHPMYGRPGSNGGYAILTTTAKK